MTVRCLILCVSSAVFVISSAARGNAAADEYIEGSKGVSGGVGLARPTALEIERESLKIDCQEERTFGSQDGVLLCSFRAVYHVQNPEPKRHTVRGAFYGSALQDVTITADGSDLRVDLKAEELERLEGRLAGKYKAISKTRRRGKEAFGFQFAVSASSRRDLVVTGTMVSKAGYLDLGGYEFFRPDQWVHPVMNSEAKVRTDTDFEYSVEYLIYPVKTWKRVGPIALELSWDSGLEFQSKALTASGVLVADADGELQTDLDSSKTPTLDLQFTRRKSAFYEVFQPGGPELRLGVRYGDGNPKQLASLGWDWSWGHYLFQSLSYERGPEGYEALVPMVLKANLLVLGVGVGLPQLLPTRQSGVRLQCSFSFPAVALSYFYDRFGASGGAPSRRQSGVALVLTI